MTCGDAESAYFRFMEQRRLVGVEQKKKYVTTHTHFGYPSNRLLADGSEVRDRGAFHVSDKDYGEFLILYRDAAASGAYLNVMERPKRHSILCVDVDFRYSIKTTKFCSVDHAKYIHDLVVEEVSASFVVGRQKIEGYLFQKPKLEASDKDGFHLMYPDVILDEAYRKDILKALNNTTTRRRRYILQDLPLDIDKLPDIIDVDIVKNFWCAPGSAKMGNYPYAITARFVGEKKVYIHDDDDILWTNPGTPRPLVGRAREAYMNAVSDIFRSGIDSTLFVGDAYLRDEQLIRRVDNALEESGGIAIDINFSDGEDEIITTQEEARPAKELSMTGDKDRGYIRSLLNSLHRWRRDEYYCWSKICWILKSESESYYDIFVEWSSDGCKFDEGHCHKLWERGDQRNLTIGALKYWARQDSPDECAALHRSDYRKQIDEVFKAFIERTDSDEVATVYEI